ncbi:hypothetical protein KP509_31G029400 [Ceratopteris richardii]|nr:hypothetical protein KP509_31G029400 [Ceratopteris richardii]
MSCNGCRVLRKGCSESCVLRSCLRCIESPEAQGHATVFLAKFFGRAGMLSFINAVPESERPALFQSLLYEACGRTVNPVFGAVGLLWSGNWAMCQAAVETVLRGEVLKPASTSPPLSKLMQPSASVYRDSSLKRPHGYKEGDADTPADGKRCRLSDQHEQQLDSRCQVDVAQRGQGIPVFSRNCELNVTSNPRFPTLMHQQRPSRCGQLIAPVARRVKLHLDYGLAARVISEDHEQVSSDQDKRIYKDVHLDLALNSNRNMDEDKMERRDCAGVEATLKVAEGLVEHNSLECSRLCNQQIQEAPFLDHVVRSSSPCSVSANSEGSVTSLDTAEFSASCVGAYDRASSRHDACQLLPLL